MSLICTLFVMTFFALSAYSAPKGVDAILFNPQEIPALLEKYKVPKRTAIDLSAIATSAGLIESAPRFTSQTELCLTLELPCLTLAYIGATPLPANSMIFSLRPSDSTDRGSNKLTDADMQLNYIKTLFAFDGYNSISKLRSRDRKTVDKALWAYVNNKIEYTDMENFVFQHSRGFEQLPQTYGAIRIKNASLINSNIESPQRDVFITKIHKIEMLILRAYFATIDVLVQQTTMPSPLYQFNDGLVTSKQLININTLYKELTAQKLWPRFKALTPQVRSNSPARYRSSTSRRHYITRGYYEHTTRTLWIDYEGEFFENIYTLYHEMWHLLWANSNAGNADAQNLEKIIHSKQFDLLPQTIDSIVSRNELLGLDQQIRLFHAAGPLTDLWGPAHGSALGWHDAYYGSNIYKYFRSKKLNTLYNIYNNADTTIALGLEKVVKSIIKMMTSQTVIDLTNFFAVVNLPEAYFDSQIQSHKANFEARYFSGRKTNIEASFLVRASNLQNIKIEAPYKMNLTCAEVKQLKAQLKLLWSSGIPVSYQITNCEECKDEQPYGGHPGNDGGHPGNDGGHPGNDGGHPGNDGGHPSYDFEY